MIIHNSQLNLLNQIRYTHLVEDNVFDFLIPAEKLLNMVDRIDKTALETAGMYNDIIEQSNAVNQFNNGTMQLKTLKKFGHIVNGSNMIKYLWQTRVSNHKWTYFNNPLTHKYTTTNEADEDIVNSKVCWFCEAETMKECSFNGYIIEGVCKFSFFTAETCVINYEA